MMRRIGMGLAKAYAKVFLEAVLTLPIDGY